MDAIEVTHPTAFFFGFFAGVCSVSLDVFLLQAGHYKQNAINVKILGRG